MLADKQQISVLIADDEVLFRGALCRALSRETGLEVVAEAGNTAEAVNIAVELKPDVVLIGLKSPLIDGMPAARMIRVGSPRTKILALSELDSEGYIAEAIFAGADGHLSKMATLAELVSAVKTLSGNRETAPNRNVF
jgi:two-component system response regulator DesR